AQGRWAVAAGPGRDLGDVEDRAGGVFIHHVGDVDREGCARVRSGADGRVIDVDGDRVAGLGLVIEDRPRLDVQAVAVDLEEARIGPGQRQIVGSQSV